MAAQWEYDSDVASDLFNMALLESGAETMTKPKWPPGFLALAIEPLFAPALLTVGSLEYQHGFLREAMEMFLTLTRLPENEILASLETRSTWPIQTMTNTAS